MDYRVLPARQQILRLDGEDEGGTAADDGAARALSVIRVWSRNRTANRCPLRLIAPNSQRMVGNEATAGSNRSRIAVICSNQ